MLQDDRTLDSNPRNPLTAHSYCLDLGSPSLGQIVPMEAAVAIISYLPLAKLYAEGITQ